MMIGKQTAGRWMKKRLRGHLLSALFLLLLGYSQRVYAQVERLTTPVSLHASSITVAELVTILEKQTSYRFSGDHQVLSGIVVRDIQWDHLPLGKALAELKGKAGLDYLLVDRNISISHKWREPARTPSKPGRTSIRGKVKDAGTGVPLSGVTVQGGGASAVTNDEGAFAMEVKDTSAALEFSMIGYTRQRISMGGMNNFIIGLTGDKRLLMGVVVEARRRANTEAAVLSERQHAAVVSDGISAQNIEKTASITTAQALQRVTGVTISNDRNVAIRGLGDRNVVAQLNGARLSSSNPDQNSPSLDLVPAGLLESITVYKTVTADKPADATAGIIELKTKSIPEKFTLSVTTQVGTNTTTGIGGSFNSFKGSSLGPFGQQVKQRDLPGSFYDLSKQFPQGYTQLYEYFFNSRNSAASEARALAIDKQEKAIPGVLMPSYRAAAPNQIYTLGIGNTFHLEGEQAIGVVVGLNYYKRTTERYNGVVNQYSIYQGSALSSPVIPAYTDPNNINLGKFAGYKESTGNEQLNFGGLATVTYRLDRRNEISVNLLFNQGANEGGTTLDGQYDNTGALFPIRNQVYQLSQSFRTFNTLQLRGEHKFSSGDYSPQLSWNVSTSHATELDPDNRFFSLIEDSTVYGGSVIGGFNPNGKYYQPLKANVDGTNYDPNGRKYRHLVETNRNYTLDLTLPFRMLGDKQVFKAGVYYLRKNRTYSEYVLYLPDIVYTSTTYNTLFPWHGNLNAWVAPGNIGFANTYDNEGQARDVGWLYYPQKTFNNYFGYAESQAGYVMVDLKPAARWRLAGGVRFESTDIKGTLDTLGGSTDPIIYSLHRVDSITSKYNPGFKPYYSGTLIYNPRPDMNVRLAYATTLARPELRELMPTLAFDPFQYAVVTGNPALQNQLSRNMDFRWEWFPHPGEVFSVSAFYKLIDHQLTRTFSSNSGLLHTTGAQYNVIRYENDPSQGKVYGLELEARKNLGQTFPLLRNFFVGANLLLARSIIRKNSERLAASRTIDLYASAYSPVFEQPPYSLNTWLDYDNRKSGTDITLSFNIVGPRLVQVRMTGEPDLYDHPVPTLDWVLSQRLGKHFVAKAFVKNILDPPVQQYYATPGGSYTKFAGHTYLNSSYYQGREIALGVTYNIF